MHRSEYDASAANMVLGQAAIILKAIGFAAKHVVLIGGSVPGLLVPELDPGDADLLARRAVGALGEFLSAADDSRR